MITIIAPDSCPYCGAKVTLRETRASVSVTTTAPQSPVVHGSVSVAVTHYRCGSIDDGSGYARGSECLREGSYPGRRSNE